VELRTRFGGQLTIDGRPIRTDNSSPTFKLKLLPGTHDVIVRHTCCAPRTQQISVNRNRPEQIYKLDYGDPLPARLLVKNAPPDAPVLIDQGKGPVLMGRASDPVLLVDMKQLDQQVTVSIGGRSLSLKIRAGWDNVLDYAKGTP
jgi:hypothetical protein